MTKVPECKKCGRKNTFVESNQTELCAVCEKEEQEKEENKNNEEK